MLVSRKFDIYQKAIIINCLVLSKVWYVSHIYPLSYDFAKSINSHIFPYIWNSKLNPLKRDILYNKKDAGGINLLNVFYKAKSIYAKSFLRLFCASSENESLVKYYCAIRLNPLFKIRRLPTNVSYLSSPLYTPVIDTIRECSKMKNFPNVPSREIYEYITSRQTPKVEEQYSLFNWKIIWKNVGLKYLCSDDRSVIFKFIHEILPNKLRLYNIKSKPSPNCDTCNMIENNLHMVYYC